MFAGFPYTVHGKTGTAERAPNPDQSWYACYVDDPVKPIVVVMTIEKGGFGAETAAPGRPADPLEVVRRQGPRLPRRRERDAMSRAVTLRYARAGA